MSTARSIFDQCLILNKAHGHTNLLKSRDVWCKGLYVHLYDASMYWLQYTSEFVISSDFPTTILQFFVDILGSFSVNILCIIIHFPQHQYILVEYLGTFKILQCNILDIEKTLLLINIALLSPEKVCICRSNISPFLNVIKIQLNPNNFRLKLILI